MEKHILKMLQASEPLMHDHSSLEGLIESFQVYLKSSQCTVLKDSWV